MNGADAPSQEASVEPGDLAGKISNVHKVNKVFLLDMPEYENPIAEIYEPVITSLSQNYSHILGNRTSLPCMQLRS